MLSKGTINDTRRFIQLLVFLSRFFFPLIFFRLLDHASVPTVVWIQRSFPEHHRLSSRVHEVSHISLGLRARKIRVWLDDRGWAQATREITVGLHGSTEDQVAPLQQFPVFTQPAQGMNCPQADKFSHGLDNTQTALEVRLLILANPSYKM